MIAVNIHQAKTHFSALVAKVESGKEEVIISRNGRNVAELVPFRRRGLRQPLRPQPDLACLKVKCDLTAPLGEDEWPEAKR